MNYERKIMMEIITLVYYGSQLIDLCSKNILIGFYLKEKSLGLAMYFTRYKKIIFFNIKSHSLVTTSCICAALFLLMLLCSSIFMDSPRVTVIHLVMRQS